MSRSSAAHIYAIALGSNRRHGLHGGPKAVLDAAARQLAETGGTVLVRSTTVQSAALGPSRRRFANAVVILETALLPPALLAALQAIERRFGRRRGRRWGARVLDLDIILWSGGAYGDPALVIPHPRWLERAFVAGPLAQIAPDWRDPITQRTARQTAARLRRARPHAVDPARANA